MNAVDDVIATHNNINHNDTNQIEPVQIIRNYIDSQHVLSLCCQDGEQLWCANCFYLFEPETMSFLVMTDHQTRHGQMIKKNNRIAGTISEQKIDIVELKGIQFSGTISLLIGNKDDVARHHYYERFPVARLIPSPIWRISIDDVKMTDNSAGFANKYAWNRS